MKKDSKAKRIFGRFSFRRRLFLYFFAVNLLILVGMGTYFNYYYSHKLYADAAGNVDIAMSRLSTDISHIAGTVTQVSDRMMEDSRVSMAMSVQGTRRDFNTQMEDFQVLKGMVNTVYSNNVPIKTTLYFNDDVVYTGVDTRFRKGKVAEEFPWYADIDMRYGGIYWTDVYDLSDGKGPPAWVFGASRSMRGISWGDPSPGLVSVYFSVTDFQRLMKETEDRYGSQLLLVNHTGSVLVSSLPQEQGMHVSALPRYAGLEVDYEGRQQFDQDLEDGEYHINSIPVAGCGWVLVSLTPIGFLRGENRGIWMIVAVIGVAGLLMMILDSLLSRSLTSRVKRLLAQVQMPAPGAGIPATPADDDFHAEISSLTSAFSAITNETRRLEESLQEQDLARREARLYALQSQIDSHFLYNSLDVVNWMAMDIGADGISTMVQLLSKYYRLSLSGGMEMTTVTDEVEHARSYLEIQKIRFEERIRYTLTMQEGLGSHRIVKLILQPVVENAIVHGLMLKEDPGGDIDIKVANEKGSLVVRVRDNGLGIPPEKVEAINSGVVTRSNYFNDPPRGSNVGLHNIRERLDLHYRGKATLTVQSQPGNTVVTITTPILPGEE